MSTGIPFGHYTLIRRIARGGMAEVFLAVQKGPEGFERPVAVKRILPHLADVGQFRDMFMEEARLAAQLSHPNIAHIYDFGCYRGNYYIAMEFIDGIDLSVILTDGERRPLPLEHAARIIAEVCAALHHAHNLRGPDGTQLGIVHRDISPQNVMVSFDGSVKVLDFGIAKAAHHIERTQPGVVRGKFSYMSPEQVVGRKLDGRADLFCVGIVLYELCTCGPLFPRTDAVSAMRRIRGAQIPQARRCGSDLPPGLSQVLARSLARRPEDRYPDAAEMQLDLEHFLHSQGLFSNSVLLGRYMIEHYRAARQDLAKKGEALHAADMAQTPMVEIRGDAGNLRSGELSVGGKGTPRVVLMGSGGPAALLAEENLAAHDAGPAVADHGSGRPGQLRTEAVGPEAGGPEMQAGTIETEEATQPAVLALSGLPPPAWHARESRLSSPGPSDAVRPGAMDPGRNRHTASPPEPATIEIDATNEADLVLASTVLAPETLDAPMTRPPVARPPMALAPALAPTARERRGRWRVWVIVVGVGLAMAGATLGYLGSGTPRVEFREAPSGSGIEEDAVVWPAPDAARAAEHAGGELSAEPLGEDPTVEEAGALLVVSEPPGASIMVDGQAIPGETPMTQPLPPGSHHVTVALAGHEPQTQEVVVQAGRVAQLSLQLVPSADRPVRPSIRVETPALHEGGADPSDRPSPPTREQENPAVSRRPPRPATGSRPVASSETPAPPAPVPPPPGTISVITLPWTQVFLDEKLLGITPLARLPLPAGRHILRFKNPEGIDKKIAVLVKSGEVTKLRLDLR